MQTAVIEEICPKIVEEEEEVPMFDEDDWDFGKDSSDNSIPSCTTQDDMINHIEDSIRATRQDFYKAGKLDLHPTTSKSL